MAGVERIALVRRAGEIREEPATRRGDQPRTRLPEVGSSDDRYEMEADRVADHVVARLGSDEASRTPLCGADASPGRIRRGFTDRGAAAVPRSTAKRTSRVRRATTGGRDGPVVGPAGGELDGDTATRITAAGPGRPFDHPVRQRIQRALGQSFEDVRVHTDSDVAPAIGARAFTYRNHIHFARGEFQPDSADGLRVLAHELSHVTQNDRSIHRLMLPAYVHEAAGIHDFDTLQGGEAVKKGGLGRRGILADIPAGTLITYDSARQHPTYRKVTWNGVTGYVNRSHLDESQRIAGSEFYLVEDTARGSVKVWNSTAGTYLADVLPAGYKATILADLTMVLDSLALAETRTGLDVVKKHNVIANVLHQAALGAPVDAGLWPLAAANLDGVEQRVRRDLPTLVRAGLTTPHAELDSVEFSGADFHKQGQAPLFLRFTDRITGDTSKLVYKPSDLSVDRSIFGRNDIDDKSVAQTLDPSGSYISQYRIVTAEDAQHHEYGYMEFVESGEPTNRDELLSVYRSLAQNMALSYLVGLEDVHHENVLLLRDRVQVIDMEATTGNFKIDPTDLSKGGFVEMLWHKAINDGIRPKLQAAVRSGTLTTVPDTASVKTAMKDAFQAALGRAARRPRTMSAHARNLADLRARIVPVATSEFYAMITRAKGAGSPRGWCDLVDRDPALVTQAKGAAGHTDAFVERLLKSPGTYAALRRGEVPYYSRDLGSQDIFDELGNRIDATGCSKVGEGIDTQMGERRRGLRDEGYRERDADVSDSDVMKMFDAQIVSLHIAQLNDALVAAVSNG